MALTCDDDWQFSKRTVLERNMYMFDNPLFSDISFTCGESRRVFHAHKYVLATSSAVFEAMFYGVLAERGPTICISDTVDESFEEFLRFLYTDDCKVTDENVIGIVYLAKKYLISPLAEKCCKVLEANLKPENVIALLEQAIQFNEKELEAKCWNIVSMKTREVVNAEGFCNISSRTLNDLLKRETLEITEVELFKGVLKWADSECARQGMNIEEDNTARRRVLGEMVYEIRFLAMSEEEFAKHVLSCKILTDAEVICFFKKFNGLDVADFKWEKERPRHFPYSSVRKVSFDRFKPHFCDRSLFYDGISSDALTLVVNKAVFFHGVRFFGNRDGMEHNVKFTVKGESETGTYTSEQDNDGVWGYDVMLPIPILLSPNEEVTIIATIEGPFSQRGDHGKSSVKVDDTVVTFKDSDLSSNGTNKIEGQFYKVYLSDLC